MLLNKNVSQKIPILFLRGFVLIFFISQPVLLMANLKPNERVLLSIKSDNYNNRFTDSKLLIAFENYSVSGRVTNVQGELLEGVTVSIEGTNFATLTTSLGEFKFNDIPEGNYSLVFSFIGYSTVLRKVELKGNTTLDIQLDRDLMRLDDVVVTGVSAGTTKRELGSYISSVDASDLEKGATKDVLAALQGKTLGAQITQNSGDPSGGLSVRLRGISSINSGSDPLYIVDGVIINNNTNYVTNVQYNNAGSSGDVIGQSRISDINPDDIERIEVLNGAAAAAIYGSRANAGVIQIFTKKGKIGEPRINFSSNVTRSDLRRKLGMNQSPTKFGGPTDGPGAQTQDILDLTLNNTTPVTRYDYQDYIFHAAYGTDNNLSISGGSDKTKYYISGSYFYNQGILKNSDYQRYSFRSNIEQEVSKWFKMNLGLNYINSVSNEKPDGNSFYSPLNSIQIIGNFHNIWERDALGNIKAVGERGRINPVSAVEDFKQKNGTDRILTNISAQIHPFRNLTLDYTMGIDNYGQRGTTFIPPYAYNVTTGSWGGGPTLNPTLNGYSSAGRNNFFGINHDVNLTYNANITEKWTSVTQIGYSEQYERNQYLASQGRGLAPFVQTVTGASTVLPNKDIRSELSISGVFLQQNFKYNNQLFLTGAIRRDGSSVFGTNQRNQIYVKGSGSYIVSSTEFWKGGRLGNWWSLAKLRIAYGESGNLTGIGAFERINTYSSSSFLGKTALNSSQELANENVKPERQAELELGMDLAFFQDRLGITVNYYTKKVTDLLISRVLAPTSGFTHLLDNAGSLQNRGIEIMMNAIPIRTRNFSWNITGLFNRNRNKVVNTGQNLMTFSVSGGAPTAIIEGQPVGVFYGTFFALEPGAKFEGMRMDGTVIPDGVILSHAGIPRTAYGNQVSVMEYELLPYLEGGPGGQGIPQGVQLRKIIGDPNPDYTASITSEVNYRKFSFRFQIDLVRGLEVFNADFRTWQGVGNGLTAELEQEGKIPRGYIAPYSPNSSVPTGVYLVEQWRVEDGAYTKLRELSVGYSFGRFSIFKNIDVMFSGRNLVSWDNYQGYDPEVNSGGQSTISRGIDFGATPIPRTFSLGFRANF